MISNRLSKGQNTFFEWIPSHLDRKHSPNKENRWQEIIREYGPNKAWLIRSLNEGADKLASNPQYQKIITNGSESHGKAPEWLIINQNYQRGA